MTNVLELSVKTNKNENPYVPGGTKYIHTWCLLYREQQRRVIPLSLADSVHFPVTTKP